MLMKQKYINWQIDNKEHLKNIYYIIENTLKKNNIIIIDKNNLYKDVVEYLYKIKEK